MKRRIAMLLFVLWVALAGAAYAQVGSEPLRATPAGHEILVRFRSGTSQVTRELVAIRLGGRIVKTNPVLGYDKILVTDPAPASVALRALVRDSRVAWAEPNGRYHAVACTGCPQDPYLLPLPDALPTGENQWGMFATGIPWLWRQGGGGSGIVAVLDTGIDNFGAPHPDLAANVNALGHDFVDDDAVPTDVGAAAALYGHGTHVAGIIGAVANASGIAGVAYSARIMVVRVLDCSAGSSCPGSFEDVADGIQFAADNGAGVINMSLAGTDPSATVRTAIQYAIGKGVIVVAASGNDGAALVGYPARYPEVIAVGAIDSTGSVASFSNYGDELDVVAPGVGIWSTFPGATYRRFAGTSQAAPLVAGVAAIVASRNPAITQEELERYLRSHANPLAGANAAKDGYGLLAFPALQDWSDLPPPFPATQHGNYAWEWLGIDASSELSISDPSDTDFRPNIGGSQHADGYDDGAFPMSYPRLPFLPPHLSGGAAMDYGLQVSRYDGPRYGATPAQQLHLDSWFDWDSDLAFETGTAAERAVADHVENPGTWGGNGKLVTRPITPVDEHILGNPLSVRTRLSYGASPGNPTDPAKYGEVEDASMVNFVEDFDITRRVHTSGVYTVSTTWTIGPDPTPPCTHHGSWHLATSNHPAGGVPCNGSIESVNVIATPLMNWKEFTRAHVSFWYCHQATACSPRPDFCRVRIDTSGVKTDLGPIAMGTGMFMLDVSAYVGSETVRIEIVEDTDWNGRIAIDDLVVVAFDGQRPIAISDLMVNRTAGAQQLDLGWTAKREDDVTSSPPTQGVAATYDMRYHTMPIATAADWDAAQRFEPRDVVGGGGPTPGNPGAAQGASFRGPSAFQPYYVAMRVGDEVVNLSDVSNAPGTSTVPTLAVQVLSLADTIVASGATANLRYRVTNAGNAPDTYALSASDTRGWTLMGLPSAVALPAGSAATFVLPVTAGAGGERDTVTLTALSLANGTTTASGAGVIEVTGALAAPGPVASATGVRVLGPNPFRESVGFGLQLAAAELAAVSVYDVTGRQVRRLGDRVLPAGAHRFAWDGRDDEGHALSSGVYFLDVRTPSLHQRERLLRVK